MNFHETSCYISHNDESWKYMYPDLPDDTTHSIPDNNSFTQMISTQKPKRHIVLTQRIVTTVRKPSNLHEMKFGPFSAHAGIVVHVGTPFAWQNSEHGLFVQNMYEPVIQANDKESEPNMSRDEMFTDDSASTQSTNNGSESKG
jgi:hypothetical protein